MPQGEFLAENEEEGETKETHRGLSDTRSKVERCVRHEGWELTESFFDMFLCFFSSFGLSLSSSEGWLVRVSLNFGLGSR